MARSLILVIATVTALSGCANPNYRPGATQTQPAPMTDAAFVKSVTSGVEDLCPKGQVFKQTESKVEAKASVDEWDHSRSRTSDGYISQHPGASRGRYPAYGYYQPSRATKVERDVGHSRTASQSGQRSGECVPIAKKAKK